MTSTTLRKSVVSKTEDPRELRTQELVISISKQVLEHAIGKVQCEHCQKILKSVRCDKCGKISESLEKVNPHSDFLYCRNCLEVEI